jgi:hypothetical protein
MSNNLLDGFSCALLLGTPLLYLSILCFWLLLATIVSLVLVIDLRSFNGYLLWLRCCLVIVVHA